MTSRAWIYLAAKYDAIDRIRVERTRIESLGYKVTSTWLDQYDGIISMSDAPESTRRAIARRDLKNVKEADLFITDTMDENHRGGREVEYGVAYAKGQLVWIVGPQRNVFHSIADKHFDSWDQVLEELRDYPVYVRSH